MGPEGMTQYGAFTRELLPAFYGHTPYSVYGQDVEIWILLTTLELGERGPALIGRPNGEVKASAKTIGARAIGADDGVVKILDHSDKSYGIDTVDQLDIDLAVFLDYSWSGNTSVEQLIARFHARLDRIAELAIDEKLKGHFLLRQAGLDAHALNMIVGASSGNT